MGICVCHNEFADGHVARCSQQAVKGSDLCYYDEKFQRGLDITPGSDGAVYGLGSGVHGGLVRKVAGNRLLWGKEFE